MSQKVCFDDGGGGGGWWGGGGGVVGGGGRVVTASLRQDAGFSYLLNFGQMCYMRRIEVAV